MVILISSDDSCSYSELITWANTSRLNQTMGQ